MKNLREIDNVRLLVSVEADLDGARQGTITIPAGEIGTIVCVHGPLGNADGYTVEFPLEDIYTSALASVYPDQLTLYTKA